MSFLTDSIIVFSKEQVEVTIHINIFLPSGNGEHYFEMGILARNRGGKEILIEISFPIEHNDFQFEDLCNRFEKNPKYLELVFNQNNLMFENKEFEIEGNKTIFSQIDSNNIPNNKIILRCDGERYENYYFRFRLKNIKEEILCLEKETTSFMIDPFKRFINISGFHINNIRNQKDKVLNLAENKIAIKEINTFFIYDITTMLIDSSIPKQSFRLLEDNTWEEYISSSANVTNDCQKKIIYQFKKTCKDQQEGLKDFKLFVKTSHIVSSKHKLIVFICIIIGIALIANFLYDLLSKVFS